MTSRLPKQDGFLVVVSSGNNSDDGPKRDLTAVYRVLDEKLRARGSTCPRIMGATTVTAVYRGDNPQGLTQEVETALHDGVLQGTNLYEQRKSLNVRTLPYRPLTKH